MRSVIISCVILILIIITIVSSMIITNNITQNIANSIIPLEKALKEGDAQKTLTAFDATNKLWNKNMSIYEMLYEHDEMDLIQTSFSRLEACIKIDDFDQAQIELSQIKSMLKHLPAKDKLTPNNLF